MKRAMRFQDARMRPLLNSRNQCQQLSQEYMLYKVGNITLNRLGTKAAVEA